MNPSSLQQGMACTLADGSVVEIQAVMPDEIHIRVKYTDSLDNPEIPVGAVREIPFEDIIGEESGAHTEALT